MLDNPPIFFASASSQAAAAVHQKPRIQNLPRRRRTSSRHQPVLAKEQGEEGSLSCHDAQLLHLHDDDDHDAEDDEDDDDDDEQDEEGSLSYSDAHFLHHWHPLRPRI